MKRSADGSTVEAKGLTTSYLVLYNLFCLVGWCYVVYLIASFFYQRVAVDGESSLSQLLSGETLMQLWFIIEMPMKLMVSAACLEILHALLGLVRSSAATVAVQGVCCVPPPVVVCVAPTGALPREQAQRHPPCTGLNPHPTHLSRALPLFLYPPVQCLRA